MHRYIQTARVLLLLIAFLAIWPLSTVTAHVALKASSPAEGATVTEPIERVELIFSGNVLPLSTLTVTETSGGAVPPAEILVEEKQVAAEFAAPLEDGEYKVEWTIVAGDGHTLKGDYSFVADPPEVAPEEPTPAPTPTPAPAEEPVPDRAAANPPEPAQPVQPALDTVTSEGGAAARQLLLTFILLLLYVSLAIVVSMAFLRLIPSHRMPLLQVPRGTEQAAVMAVIISSILAVMNTAQDLVVSFGISFEEAMIQALYSTSQGLGLLGILCFGASWYGADALAGPSWRKYLQLTAALGLIVSAAAGTHAATLSTSAMAGQAIHLLAVSAWLGTLFVVGWFAGRETAASSWGSFYGWFTPVAAGSVLAVTASGFLLMNVMSEAWLNAWMLDYGQVLLMKHLLIVPLLVMASVNAFLIAPKARQLEGGFDPRPWMRTESLLSLAIFAVTAVLSRQPTPHNVEETLRYTPPSAWFARWYEGAITPDTELRLRWSFESGGLAVTALLLLGSIYVVYARKAHPSIALCAALLAAIMGYAALMTAVV